MRALATLNRFIQGISAAALAVMTALVIIQVFYRYVLKDPLTVTQEISVYAMVWVVMLGSTIAVRNRTHIAVTLVVDKMPPGLRRGVTALSYAIVLAFWLVMLIQGWKVADRAMLQISPSSGIPVGWVMLSIPLSAAVSILYTLELFLADVVRGANPGREG
ncbi:MAG: TRAP transporter small permease [Thermodesulfobacteriota bacterium]